MRKQRIPLASGILLGYAVATLTSGGQCTFWVSTNDYGFAEGFIFYLLALAVVFVVLIAAMIADAIRSTLH
ncbi:MAG: hypothetical protein AB4911_16120 [Oscillochloridaceae bacterium umkhey_bin13]